MFTARKRSLRQGNIFTSVCHSFCPQGLYPSMQWAGGVYPCMQLGCLLLGLGGCTPPGQTPPWEDTPPRQAPLALGQTQHPPPPRRPLKRAVRILLE